MRVLFVCLGNICRSPTAEAVFRTSAEKAGLAIEVDSAGTGDWHIGSPPYGPAVAKGAEHGYDLAPLRARQVTVDDFKRFDRIVAMDAQNFADLKRMAPRGAGAILSRLMDHAPRATAPDVPDPYYTRDFDTALTMIEAGVEGLLSEIAAQLRQ